LITQQHATPYCAEIATRLRIPFWTLIHGPGQGIDHERAELFIYNSKQLMESETEKNRHDLNKVFLQPAIDIASIKPKIRMSDKGKTKATITFIGSTSYNYLKGCDVVVELARIMPDYKFQYVGPIEPIQYNKEYYLVGKMPELEPNSIKYRPSKLPKNLHVIANTHNLEPIFHRSSLIMIPSIVESFGRVAVEAAAYGIPVVASDLPGLREATASFAYYVKDYRNVEKWASVVTSALADKESQTRCQQIVHQYLELQKSSMAKIYKLMGYSSPESDLAPLKRSEDKFKRSEDKFKRSEDKSNEGTDAADINYINLSRRADRNKSFLSGVPEGISVKRFTAVDGAKLQMTPEICYLLRNNTFSFRRNTLGCALSHMQLWKEFLADASVPYIAVVEDDVVFKHDFPSYWQKLVKEVKDKINEVDLLWFGYNVNSENAATISNTGIRAEDSDLDLKIVPMDSDGYWCGAYGYILSRSGAEKLLAAIEKHGLSDPIDRLMTLAMRQNFGDFKAYGTVPRLVSTQIAHDNNDVDSDVQRDFESLPYNLRIFVSPNVSHSVVRSLVNEDAAADDYDLFIASSTDEGISELADPVLIFDKENQSLSAPSGRDWSHLLMREDTVNEQKVRDFVNEYYRQVWVKLFPLQAPN
jgi:GR25 family glycosyltransferase involved in LPS biosynthesis